MKRLRFCLLCVLSLLCCVGARAGYMVDGIRYAVISEENSEAKVIQLSDWGSDRYSGDFVIPSVVYLGGKPYRVTTIGERAFGGCSGLTSIDLGEVTTIEEGAFQFCENLLSIDLKKVTSLGKDAFNACRGLTFVNFKNVETIGTSAFKDCTGLTGIDLSNVQKIDNFAFQNCTGLIEADLKKVTLIGYSVFNGCSQLNAVYLRNLRSVSASAFSSCERLSSIDFGKVEFIGESAFSFCSTLASVDLKNVKIVGKSAFYLCKNLVSVDLQGVEIIGNGAFSACDQLQSIDLKTVRQLDDRAFAYNDGLVAVDLKQVEKLGSEVFAGCTALKSVDLREISDLEYGTFTGCTHLETIDLSKVKRVGSKVFENCEKLSTVRLQAAESVGYCAFSGCTSLSAVSLGAVRTLGESAFNGCTALASIRLDRVQEIGDYAFSGCTGLKAVDFRDVRIIGAYAFEDCSGLTALHLENVRVFGEYAFVRCQSLAQVEMGNIQYIDRYIFGACPLKSLHVHAAHPARLLEKSFHPALFDSVVVEVPEGSLERYQSDAVWKKFSHLQEYPLPAHLLVSPQTADLSSTLEFPVELVNKDTIVAFQFDLLLPDGITVAQDENGYQVALNPERNGEGTHVLMANQLSNGCFRVLCYSHTNAPFIGNSGEVLRLNLNLSPNLIDGDYPVELRKVILTNHRKQRIEGLQTTVSLSLSGNLLGDVNDDHYIDVSDIAGTVAFIMSTSTEGLIAKSADVNEDGAIDVSDIACIVHHILQQNLPASARRPSWSRTTSYRVHSDAHLDILPFTLTPGEKKEVELLLNNPDDIFSGFQFDLVLPEGVSLQQDADGYLVRQAAQRLVGGQFVVNALPQKDGSIRVLVYTATPEVIQGNCGAVLHLSLEGTNAELTEPCPLQMKNVVLTHPSGRTNVKPADRDIFLRIDSVGEDPQLMDIYTVDGKLLKKAAKSMDGLSKGIYIVNGKKWVIE